MIEQELAAIPHALQAPSSDPEDFPKVSETDAQQITETAKQLESLILYQLLKQMWDTIPEGTLFAAGPAEKMYREMWIEQLSGSAVKHGSVLGISDMVQHELLDKANRTVSAAEMMPELAGLQKDLRSEHIRQANPYGYLSGQTAGLE